MAKQQKIVIEIPTDFDEEERSAIGKEIITFIQDRTASGLDKNNRRFPSYSKSYIESFEFKVAGKDKGEINLALSHDMMNALDVISTSRGKIVIGYEAGSDINDRVEGNRLGSYGGNPNPKKARDFLGINKKDLSDILDNYEPAAGSRSRQINMIGDAAEQGRPFIGTDEE